MSNTICSTILVIILIVTITGCSSSSKKKKAPSKNSRYHLDADEIPKHHEVPNVARIPDAVPKLEPKSKYGNPKQYTVNNRTYKVMSSSKGFHEVGKASWYGKKFHGYKTANGETYDMFGMTAAHKSLPIPCYVRVRNLSNNKQVIVKVNDRGPFHEDRIIDLSYTAASKLNMLNSGTTKVEIVALSPGEIIRSQSVMPGFNDIELPRNSAPMPYYNTDEPRVESNVVDNPQQLFIQLGSFRMRDNAVSLLNSIQEKADLKPIIEEVEQNNATNYKVKLGPFKTSEQMKNTIAVLAEHKFSHLVTNKGK